MKHVFVSAAIIIVGLVMALFSPVFAAPNLKNIEAKVQRQAEKRQQELISPVVEARVSEPVMAAQTQVQPVAHLEPYVEVIHSQYFNGLIKLRTISGQLYLSLWR